MAIGEEDPGASNVLKAFARRPPPPRDPVPRHRTVRTRRRCRCRRPLDVFRPPPCCCCATAGVLDAEVVVGVSSSQSVQRKWSQGPHKRFCERHRFGTARPRGWQTVLSFRRSQFAIDTTMELLLNRRKCLARWQPPRMGKFWRRPADAWSARSLSLLEKGAGRVLSSWWQIGGRWSNEISDFLCQFVWAKVRVFPEVQRDGRRARLKKLLGCAAAKSFDCPFYLAPRGCDSVVFSVHEVICEARHS